MKKEVKVTKTSGFFFPIRTPFINKKPHTQACGESNQMGTRTEKGE